MNAARAELYESIVERLARCSVAKESLTTKDKVTGKWVKRRREVLVSGEPVADLLSAAREALK